MDRSWGAPLGGGDVKNTQDTRTHHTLDMTQFRFVGDLIKESQE